MIHLRPAMMQDADDLFKWRNDPLTCACFRSTSVVPRCDHDTWMRFNVASGYPEHIVLIAQSAADSVGVVRFDADKGDVMTYEASITMAPEWRGVGLARPVLAMACGYMHDFTVKAEIRTDNIASRRIFERCGFKRTVNRDGFVSYERKPLS